ncbi:hypothetical protein P4P91_001455 [Campylobacter jejuni]|nr:hypothetical protein [Campylobacter jejuni]
MNLLNKLKKEQIVIFGLFLLVLMLISDIFDIHILWYISLSLLIIIFVVLIKKDKD